MHIGSDYYQIGLVGSDLVIGTGVGDIYLQPDGKLYYNSYEVADKNYVDSEIQRVLNGEITTVNTTTYPTLNDFLASTGEEGIIYLYPIDTTDLTKGYYRYVWENNAWLDLGTTQIDLSNYYTKSETDTLLSAKADTNTTVVDSDVTVNGGYIVGITKGSTSYPIAQSVTLYTTPKVVATTSDLPQTNDGYLYLVLADGYLYYWDTTNSEWAQGYEYVQDVSNFVQTSRTIAGIDLSANISAQTLTDALVYATNSQIENIMED